MAERTVVLYPFFSQQNKWTGKFLFRSCGSTKILKFIGEQLLRDGIADEIRFIAPESQFWEDDLSRVVPGEWIHSCEIPPDNRLQRLTWPVRSWDYIFRGADLVFNMHELVGWPLKRLYPELKVISMFTVSPTAEPWPWMEPLVRLSCRYSDLVTVPSRTMAAYMEAKALRFGDLGVWPLSFDQAEIDRLLALPPSGRPPVDVLFVFRASASNYTHHREFIGAVRLLRERKYIIRIAFTDATRYLRRNPEELVGLSQHDMEVLDDPGHQEEYVDLLRRSRIVVAMNDNMHGGMGVREAMYAGAVPVLLDAPCYRELLWIGTDWPAWIPSPITPEGIASGLAKMLVVLGDSPDHLELIVRGQARRESFQETWKTMKPQIERLSYKEV